MGTCLSKKGSSPSSSSTVTSAAAPPSPPTCKPKKEEDGVDQKKAVQAQEIVKKEVFLIKQRKSHERRPEEKGAAAAANTVKDESNSNGSHVNEIKEGGPKAVRALSCSKEEVDAILIQCGRLSRSSSGKAPGSSDNSNNNNNNTRGLGSSGSRKYSGSKRSYDFDQDESNKKGGLADADDEVEEEKQQLSQRRSRSSRSHRRTPSREKDVDNKRSSSRDRVSPSGREERKRSGGSGRRVSRSPARSENPTCVTGSGSNPGPDRSKPGRMVSVPASFSTKEKTNSIPDSATGIKKVTGKRGVSSPRSQSPANTRAPIENGQQVPSLSRNSSRKAEHSPYRRNPMAEIDDNILRNEQVSLKSTQDLTNNTSKATFNKLQRNREGTEERLTKKPTQLQSMKADERKSGLSAEHPEGTKGGYDNNIEGVKENNAVGYKARENQRVMEEREATGADSLKPQTITRSRSSRKSRDFDFNQGPNPDTHLNSTTYASMLLEDIQNFHQKNTTGFSLPPCVTKACSILEAVADLNSCNGSNLSSVFSDDRVSEADRFQKNITPNSHFGKRMESKEPFLESEVGVIDDLMEPSLHKYVTVRRGVMEGDMEQQESSGSNSFVTQQWASSSWEPNSADSTERWSSLSNNVEEVVVKEQQPRPSPPGYQKQAFSEPTRETQMVGRRSKQCGNEGTPLATMSQNGRKRPSDYSQAGIGHGKVAAKGQTTSIVVAAASS